MTIAEAIYEISLRLPEEAAREALGPLASLEEIVADPPALARLVTGGFRARHEEQPPALPPECRPVGAVALAKDRQDGVPAAVHIAQPGVGGPLVVQPGPAPLAQQAEPILETQRQVITGHHSAGEEVAVHPVVFALILEQVRRADR
jgi:hypothetical protein